MAIAWAQRAFHVFASSLATPFNPLPAGSPSALLPVCTLSHEQTRRPPGASLPAGGKAGSGRWLFWH